MTQKRFKGLYLCMPEVFDKVYGTEEMPEIERYVEIYDHPQSVESIALNPGILQEAEVLMASWGMPELTAELLAQAPNLKAIFYGAGSIKGFVTDAFWERKIVICSAYAANAVPVSEFVLAQILFSLKQGWRMAMHVRQTGTFSRPDIRVPGVYESTVGLVSMGMIGRMVRDKLRAMHLNVIAYDPYIDESIASDLGVELCSLEELFCRADVVSLHTPWLKQTEGLITGELIASMKEGSTFINTSRGAVVNEPEMIEVLKRRPDLFALLDVTYPEPPVPGSPLYTLPNVILTPHIAGSMEMECRRMGRYMVDELKRYAHGEPLRWALDRDKASIMA